MVETDMGNILDTFDWEVRPDFPKPIICEFPFVDDTAFQFWQRVIRLDNINVSSAFDELGLEPSHEGHGTNETYVIEIRAVQRDDYYEIVKKIRKACITNCRPYYNKVRLIDLVTERRLNHYYGKGIIECNKVGHPIYD